MIFDLSAVYALRNCFLVFSSRAHVTVISTHFSLANRKLWVWITLNHVTFCVINPVIFFLYFISINVVFVLFLAASFSPVPNTGEDTTDDIDDIRDTVSSEQGKSLEALVKGQKVIRLKNLRENSVGWETHRSKFNQITKWCVLDIGVGGDP